MSADPVNYGVEPAARHGKSIRRAAIVLLTIVVCGFGCWWGIIRSLDSRLGVNVTRSQAPIDDLPLDATNISYRVGGILDPRPLTYEFDPSEASYRAWAATMSGALEEGEIEVSRFDDSREML